jgi:hypothetical protein
MKCAESRGFKTILVFLFTLLLTVSAMAAEIKWPSTSNIKTYVITTKNNTKVYKDAKSKDGSYGTIYASDLITINGYSGSRLKVTYPIKNGTKTGYIEKSAVTNGNINKATAKWTAKEKKTTYRRSGGGTEFGYISKGDVCYSIAEVGKYTQIIYPISQGYKMGWIKTSDIPTDKADKNDEKNTKTITKKDSITQTTKIVTVNANSLSDWCSKIKNTERSITSGGQIVTDAGGEQRYTGYIITNREVLEYRKITAKIPTNKQGPNVKDNYKNVNIALPQKIKYTLHKHSLQNKINSLSSGEFIAGLVKSEVTLVQQCDCGYKNKMVWEIPDLIPEKISSENDDVYYIDSTSSTY